MVKSTDIKISVTADAKGAQSELKGLEGTLDKTGGGIGKMGVAAAAGGAALIALGTKSVLAFQDLGLTVGKFSDATGVSATEASRLIEVAGDVGIGTDALETSIGKMEKTLGANEEAFKSYGVEVAKTKDGQVDANETFINAVDALNKIEDPAKRAEAGAKIFGKGWANMAELIDAGAPKLRENLAAVDDAKIFDDKKVDDARKLRESFDTIKDSVEGVLLVIGGALAPVIATLGKKFGELLTKLSPLAEALGDLLVDVLTALEPAIDQIIGSLEALIPVIVNVVTAATSLIDVLGATVGAHDQMDSSMKTMIRNLKDAGLWTFDLDFKMKVQTLTLEDLQKAMADGEASAKYTANMHMAGEAARDSADAAKELADKNDALTTAVHSAGEAARDSAADAAEFEQSLRDAAQATRDLDTAYAALTGSLDQTEAWITAQAAVDTLKWKMNDGTSSTDEQEQAFRDAQRALADYVVGMQGIPDTTKKDLILAIDEGDLAAVQADIGALNAELNKVERARVIKIVNVSGTVSHTPDTGVGASAYSAGGSGGGGNGATGQGLAAGGMSRRSPNVIANLSVGGRYIQQWKIATSQMERGAR